VLTVRHRAGNKRPRCARARRVAQPVGAVRDSQVTVLSQACRAAAAWWLRAALAASGRGWPVFPLIPRGKRPALTGWPNQATVDAEVLAVWWRTAPYNVGIACGPARLFVVDLDGPHGRARFAELAATAEAVPTFTVATPSGGEHRY
jgi:hypothetical protein